MPALKETEDTSFFSIPKTLNKYMLEHTWNSKKNLPQLSQTCAQFTGSEIFLKTFLNVN